MKADEKPFESHRSFTPRIRFFYLLSGVAFATLFFGLAWRQLIQASIYEEKEQQQSMRRLITPGTRGNIYDRKGILLVGNRPRFCVVAYLEELRKEFAERYIQLVREQREKNERVDRDDIKRVARAAVLQKYLDKINALLQKNVQIDPKKLERHFYQHMLLPMTLIEDLTPQEYAILTEQLPVRYPIQVYVDSVRVYPYDSLAAHTLGYVVSSSETADSVPGENLTTFSIKGKSGKMGLEARFDSHLQGLSGYEVCLVDPSGYKYEQLLKKHPEQGKDFYCSLDADLQEVAEMALGDNRGAAVALDVRTGEVLVLASKPDFDLNDFTPYLPQATYDAITERGAWVNRATQGLYPPGSPFKVIASIAMLRNGYLDPHDVHNCVGSIMVGNRQFHCNNLWGHGQLDFRHAISLSCNPFFIEHALKCGHEMLADEARRFGLNQVTHIELPETPSSLIPDKQWKKRRDLGSWTGGDTANMVQGQGFTRVTPLQMACFVASLARGETRTQPTLVHDTHKQPKHGGEAIGLRPEHMKALLEGMEMASTEGTAKSVSVQGFRIAAKTGTAQIRVAGVKRFLHIAWFIGFAPIEDPQIAVAVAIEERDDRDLFYGGTTAGPVARAIFKEFARLLQRQMQNGL
ncbi:MAG: hypothetical protein A2Y14_02400 [Verrucomicrobia bacterium GWF2_51_19]|nr:MAG: hypothetical protein A2Y14_02400 [Verrucomicrobia bacterium GWF2_51_19]HCJ11965.1 peptidoglycan glycosyltransferase [Opitutae bacterium]